MQPLHRPALLAAAAALIVLVFAAPSAFAQGHVELTPFVGYRLNADVDLDLGPSVDVDESAVFGVSLDFPVNRDMAIEVIASRQETDLSLDRGIFGNRSAVADLTLTSLHAGFVYHWHSGQIDPFVVASGGLTQVDADLPEADTETRLSGSFGGGVKLRFSDHVGLRLEGRAWLTDFDASFHDEEDDEFRSDDWLVQPEASVGLIFTF